MKNNRSDEIPEMESRLIWIGGSAHPPLGLRQPIVVNKNNKLLNHNAWYNYHKPFLIENIKIMMYGEKEIKKMREKYSLAVNKADIKEGVEQSSSTFFYEKGDKK